MKFIGIIPARYASTRFPGKPLADMDGKPMIQRVYERVKDVLDAVCVATDDTRIEQAVKAFGGQVVMTSDQHRSGTDRCYEAYQKVGEGYDVVVNIQGDEPFIHPEQIQTIKACFADAGTQIATLVKPFRTDGDFESTLFNPNSPKVVLNKNNEALYFSRSIIPYIRGKNYTEWLPSHTFYKHIGLYAYRAAGLARDHPIAPVRLGAGGEPRAITLAGKRIQDQGRHHRARDDRYRYAGGYGEGDRVVASIVNEPRR